MKSLHQPLFRVVGRVHKNRNFCHRELVAMDSMVIDSQMLACGSGEPKGYLKGCRGVLLTDIINKTDVIVADHNDTKKMFLIASADDGYSTVFSWQELFNTSVGEGVIVLLEKEGEQICEKYGYVDLLSAGDFLSGPRYVKKLSKIDIILAGE